VWFTRPIGLVFALFWNRLGIHPNVITVLSIFLGIAAGVMFCFEDTAHNVAGIVLLMLANFCDSTDGQMARLSGKKTLIGRMLDGFSGDVWFFCIYFTFCLRLTPQNIPGTHVQWGVWIWLLGAVAGLVFHVRQPSLADYYRNIHLFFLKGESGSELDNYQQQRATYEQMRADGNRVGQLFFYNYANYCRSQERRTPAFQRFFAAWKRAEADGRELEPLRQDFLSGSRPLMKYTNILSFNWRAICIYATALLHCPWVYLLADMTVFAAIYVYMHRAHESLCRRLQARLNA
jgi:phosphatidylglycerophosphate synthase